MTSPGGRSPNLLCHHLHSGYWKLVRKGVAPAFNPRNIRCEIGEGMRGSTGGRGKPSLWHGLCWHLAAAHGLPARLPTRPQPVQRGILLRPSRRCCLSAPPMSRACCGPVCRRRNEFPHVLELTEQLCGALYSAGPEQYVDVDNLLQVQGERCLLLFCHAGRH